MGVMIEDKIFRNIFETMSHPAFCHGIDYRIMLANSAYLNEAGLKESEVIGKHYWEVFPKCGGPMESCKAAIASQELTASQDEITVGGKSYTSFSFIERDDQKKPRFIFHILIDITSKKFAETTLNKIVSQYEILFESSPDAIMLLDQHGFLECNLAAVKMFGCSNPSEVIGRHPSEFSPPHQPDGESSIVAATKHIEAAFQKGNHLFEWLHKRLDGSEFPAEVLLVSFVRDKKPVLQATVRDITARKLAESAIKESAHKVSEALDATVMAVSKIMGFRDPYTANHQQRVASLACAIAEELQWENDRIAGLRVAALLHDIGKIAIPSEILTKPSRLTSIEMLMTQEHPEHAYQILKDVNFPWKIAEMVRQHHERLDGSGYPKGLKGDEILPEAMVIAVADTVEAMGSHRPYRASLGVDAGVNEIFRNRGKLFSQDIVDACLKVLHSNPSILDNK